MAYELNMPGLPDLSNLDFSNIDFSKLNLPAVGIANPTPQPLPNFVPTPAPAPAPAPAPVPAAPMPDLSNIDFSNLTLPDLSNLDLSNIPGVPQMPAPAPAPAPVPTVAPVKPMPTPAVTKMPLEPMVAPEPVMSAPPPVSPVTLAPAPVPAPVPTPTPAPVPPVSDVPPSRALEPDVPLPMPTPTPAPVEPAPVTPAPVMPTGIESLAGNFELTEDFAMPSGIVAGPYSTPAVNNTPPPASTTGNAIPLPDGSTFDIPDLSSMDFSNIDLSGIDLNGLYTGGETGMPSDQAPASTTTSTAAEATEPFSYAGLTPEQQAAIDNLDLSNIDLSGFGPTGGTVTTPQTQTQTPANADLYPGMTAGQIAEIEDYFRNNPDVESLGQYSNPYYTAPAGNVYTDGQLAEMGAEPGSTVITGVNQDAYGNLTPEQQAAIDAYLAANPGGLVTTPVGDFNIPGVPTTTAVTPRPVVEALQNLSVDRAAATTDPRVASAFQLSGQAPVQRPSSNPFVRPESQQGIGSLVPSGG